MAYGLVSLWQRRRQLAIGLIAVLLVTTVPFLVHQIDENHGFSDAQAPWRDSVKSIRGRALVIVDRSSPYLLHLNPFSSNAPHLDGRVLYAADRGWRDFDVIADHPDRTPYLQASDVRSQDLATAPDVPHISLRKLHVTRSDRGRPLKVNARLTKTTGQRVVVAFLKIGEQIEDRVVLDRQSRKGETYEIDWTLYQPVGQENCRRCVGLRHYHGHISIGIGTGTSSDNDTQLRRFETELSYRVVDLRIEVLTPGRESRLVERKDGTARWRADASDAIEVSATARTP